jgi:hypothetical protein
MKRLLQFSVIYFFCQSTSFAQTNATHADSSAIQWTTETSHNFGKIKQGEPVSFIFEFVNVSKEPVDISKGIVSCTCLSIAYTQEPVMPGNKGVVKIIYSAHTASRFSKSAEIIFNNHERIELRISGEVIQ